jgi:hypothetical protein
MIQEKDLQVGFGNKRELTFTVRCAHCQGRIAMLDIEELGYLLLDWRDPICFDCEELSPLPSDGVECIFNPGATSKNGEYAMARGYDGFYRLWERSPDGDYRMVRARISKHSAQVLSWFYGINLLGW